MIHLFELLFLFPEEAGRPIKKTIGFRLTRFRVNWSPHAMGKPPLVAALVEVILLIELA
jgi:hypothetical protein